MNEQNKNDTVALIKSFLQKNKIDTSCVKEFYCSENNLEKYKKKFKDSFKNECFFFSKKVDDKKLHVIALVNIKILVGNNREVELKDIISDEVINEIETKSFKNSSIPVKTISFVDKRN